MTGVPPEVDAKLRESLGRITLYLGGSANLVKPHAWFDADYVGWASDRVASWRGYSANLRSCGPYRTVYVNYVLNPFSSHELVRLFGIEFAGEVSDLEEYVCLYVTNVSLQQISSVRDAGFTYKAFKRNIHPSIVVSIPAFLHSQERLIDDGVRLVRQQSTWR